MGKNRTIKSIANLIAKMIAHEILSKYTNRKESLNHMKSEIENYRGDALDNILKYNWNTDDKSKVKELSKKRLIKKELKEDHFKDVIFPDTEIDLLLDKTIEEFFK